MMMMMMMIGTQNLIGQTVTQHCTFRKLKSKVRPVTGHEDAEGE